MNQELPPLADPPLDLSPYIIFAIISLPILCLFICVTWYCRSKRKKRKAIESDEKERKRKEVEKIETEQCIDLDCADQSDGI